MKKSFFNKEQLKKRLSKINLWYFASFCVLVWLLIFIGRVNAQNLPKSSERAQNVLQQIHDPKAGNLPNSDGTNPNVGNARIVPDLPEYTHDKNTEIDPVAIAKRFNKQNQQVDPDVFKDSRLLIFVSFSMPEASLRRIALESKRAGGVMVLRGFKNGSMKQTITASRDVAALGAKLTIDPALFSLYQVKEVPTFVLATPNSTNCSDQNGKCAAYYAIKGDVSLHAVLDSFTQRSESGLLTNSAKTRLAKLRGE